MKFALFIGCSIPARVTQYETSARAVLERLGLGLVDVEGFNCCGYPMRNIDLKTYLLFSARNLALAQKVNSRVVTLCKCCYGSLRKANYLLRETPALLGDINARLAKEGIAYQGEVEVRHRGFVRSPAHGISRSL